MDLTQIQLAESFNLNKIIAGNDTLLQKYVSWKSPTFGLLLQPLHILHRRPQYLCQILQPPLRGCVILCLPRVVSGRVTHAFHVYAAAVHHLAATTRTLL